MRNLMALELLTDWHPQASCLPPSLSMVLLSRALHLSPADLIDTEDVTIVSATLPSDGFTLTDEEKLLVLAYRDASQETQAIVMKILSK